MKPRSRMPLASQLHKKEQAITAFVLLLFVIVPWADAVEHPGVVPKDANCTSCHAKKLTGKSVHSAMATTCSVCHVTMTQGDLTTVSLSMPREKICSACHDEAAAMRQHAPSAKGYCIDCHDAHSSEYKALLRAVGRTEVAALKTK